MNGSNMFSFGGLKEEFRRLIKALRMRVPAGSPDRFSLTSIAIPAVLAIAIIAGAGWLIDAAAAAGVRQLPVIWYTIFSKITLIGGSGYIFALSAATALGAAGFALAASAPGRKAALRLLAGRAVLIFTVAATSGIAAQVIKQCVGRARPRLLDSAGAFHFDPLTFKAVQASFPSGHTITAFAIAWTLALFFPNWRWPLFAAAVLVGISRVVIGSHYPSDVLAGAAIGLVCAIWTVRYFARRRIAVEFTGPILRARGFSRVLPALRAGAGAGKAPA